MGRTAGGASLLAGASATRLDGPLDNFIEQVFKPFLYVLDNLILKYLSDAEIVAILGEELGEEYEVDLNAFHKARIEYEVLAGASLAAKRTMAQSMTLITQIFENPSIQENLADINGEYIDFKPIVNMWMEASEWKNKNDIIKKLTPEMIQKRQAQSQAAQAQSKAAVTAQSNQQKFQQKQALEDQATDGRIKRDLVREAFKDNATSEGTQGVPSSGGLEGMQPQIA
jgi:NADH dehydrogenase/NADH:ubiquinone oxidoreductase subunit G